MSQNPTFQNYPTTAIKIWIMLGVFSMLLLVVIPALLSQRLMQEEERYLACKAGTETNCERSALWAWFALNPVGLESELSDTDEEGGD